MPNEGYQTFEDVKSRLDQIVDAVSDESLPLDEALALYEEAVGLGLRASDLLEENIEAQRAADQAEGDAAETAGATAPAEPVADPSDVSPGDPATA